MLADQPPSPDPAASRLRAHVALVASEYNRPFVDGMLSAALECLAAAGVTTEVVRVPGAFEIPFAADTLARHAAPRPDAILCLGVIWQGETNHAEHVGAAVTHALMDLQLRARIPCIHEVLTVRSEEQARARCLEPRTNRGIEAARTAVAMVRIARARSTPMGP
jgi:6,7-dimethyl-8-ribityllumazine synthase